MEENMPRFMHFFHQATNGTYKAAPSTSAPELEAAKPNTSAEVSSSEKKCPFGFSSEPAKSGGQSKKCPFGYEAK